MVLPNSTNGKAIFERDCTITINGGEASAEYLRACGTVTSVTPCFNTRSQGNTMLNTKERPKKKSINTLQLCKKRKELTFIAIAKSLNKNV